MYDDWLGTLELVIVEDIPVASGVMKLVLSMVDQSCVKQEMMMRQRVEGPSSTTEHI